MAAINDYKLMHVGCILSHKGEKLYLFLRRMDANRFFWTVIAHEEKETEVYGASVQDAIYKARKHWKSSYFRTVNCGFKYSLPERDEHGSNALFHEMVASYSSPNGIYFDEDVGYNCFVQFASLEARDIWKNINGK